MASTHRKPIVGITLDREEAGGYASVPWFALRENYCQSLMDCGATVIALPTDNNTAETYAAMCDGIVISGGGFDIDPALFGASNQHDSVTLKPERTTFELALIRAFLALDKPVLGICGGQQLMAALFGGKLYQHIPDEVEDALNHSPNGSLHNPVGKQIAHTVRLVPDTLLHSICGADEISVNSSHHQAMINQPPTSELIVNALAPDGVVEGIENPAFRFCLGVQWHPEYELSPADKKILTAFVDACRE
jgi:putative glutamine amidotransferase